MASCRFVLQQWDLPLKTDILSKGARESKGYGATNFFLRKNWNVNWIGLNTLIKEINNTSTIK